MPVSEDEFERPVVSSQPAMSKAEQRKSNKPIMEKRRRARINHCLNELKTLILDAMKKDPARHSKLEKADILEMTVKHLQQIQRQHLATAVATDPAVIMRFKNGFDECAAEVSRYIGRMGNVDEGVKQRLIAHLHRCVNSLQQVSGFPQQSIYAQNCDKMVLPSISSSSPGDVNNNSNQSGERIQIPGGLQLIPSRLPTGELALLVPNSNQISSFLTPQNQFQSILSPTFSMNKGPSAFTAVGKTVEEPQPSYSYPGRTDTNLKKYRPLMPKVSDPPDRVSSSSYQRKPADSTTSQTNDLSFKAFQVDIPNTEMKAHVSIPSFLEKKPNPNFTLNPKPRSPQNRVDTKLRDIGFEKFSKIEPLSVITDSGESRPRSTETFQQIRPLPETSPRGTKRPHSAGFSPLSTPDKISHLSVNVMVTDGKKDGMMADQCNDRYQRISVIVEDGKRDGNQQRDMWRPW